MHFMVSWATPIALQALILWVVVCAIALPTVAVYRRKQYGALSPWRLTLTAAVLLYLVGVISFTFLPLPDPHIYQCSDTAYYPRFFPGWSVRFALKNTAGMTDMGILRFATWWFVQIYLNVLLFVPWGIIAARLLHWNFRKMLLSGFGISLFIELTQLTGVWGIYACRYRTFDVDDMITNTLGAVIGWALVQLWVRHRRRAAKS